MNTSFPRVITALLALLFIVAACASDTGAQWTFAPLTASEDEQPAAAPGDDIVPAGQGDPLPPGPADPESPTEESVTQELVGEADPAEGVQAEGAAEGEPAEEDGTGAASGEPRVIELQATASLQFTDPDGNRVTDIPVTPGETILFRVDNTSNFEHNFYIGDDSQLSTPSATTDVGIPNWSSGVQELEWTVPDDVSGLKFGCTVPGHYTTMQGTFSVAEGGTTPEPEAAGDDAAATGSAAPSDSEAPGGSDAPVATAATESAAPGGPEASGAADEPVATAAPSGSATPDETAAASGESRVIELQATASLQFTDLEGNQVQDIVVTPGETILFRVDNTSGFEHNLYIGEDSELSSPSATTDVGIPNWSSGVQELEWTVPDDVSGLKFGCTVPGHYTTMQGTFSVSA